jgi:AcrR family transcriptional regulator
MPEPVEESLPRGVALTWGVAERPQRGPKRELSIERIVEAAIALADGEDLAAVSMGRVAASLGFTTMSLYRYVTSKDDLLLLMQDAASVVPIPPDGDEIDWRRGLHDWVTTNLAVYAEHPWILDIPIDGPPITPNNLLLVDWGLRSMRELPLLPEEKMSIIMLLSGFARSFGMIERDLKRAGARGESDVSGGAYSAALRELVTAERFPYLHPLVMAGGYVDESGAALPTEGFVADDATFGLERILDGIQHYLELDAAERQSKAPVPVQGSQKRASYLDEPYPKDAAVREAASARREAEVRLREATKREAEAIGKARERAAREAERAAKETERTAKRAEKDASRR